MLLNSWRQGIFIGGQDGAFTLMVTLVGGDFRKVGVRDYPLKTHQF